jgi:hypothetical protein
MNPYQKSKEMGYSDEQIIKYLDSNPKYSDKLKKSRESGYSDQEILKFLSTYTPKEESQEKPERSILEKTGRVIGQFGIGLAENALFPYEVGVAPLASKSTQNMIYREGVGEDIERLKIKKHYGVDWDAQDEELLESLEKQIQDPRESEKFTKPIDITTRGLIEKATGIDTHPEDWLEKSASFLGFIKDPRKTFKELIEIGIKNPKEIFKFILPTKTELIRSSTAGAALEIAEDGGYGPLGAISATILGDVIGLGIAGLGKGAKYIAKNPKKAAAQFTNYATGANSQKAITEQLINDANKLGIQLDAGTITNSSFVKMLQARAAQSGLTGNKLKDFKEQLANSVFREYDSTVGKIADATFENNYQTAEAIKNAIKVEQKKYNFPQNLDRKGRSLQGRISTTIENIPEYETQQLLNQIAPEEFRNSYIAGESLKTAAEDIKAPIKQEFNQRFDNFTNQVREIPMQRQPQLNSDIRMFIDEHKGSLLLGESAPEARVVRAAENLLESLDNIAAREIGVSVEELIKTKRTLQDVVDWEFGGSNFESAYKKLVSDIDQAINRTLEQVAPELRQEYQLLNADYSAYKDLFENKNVLPLFEPKNENYISIYNKIVTDPDKLRSVEDIFHTTPRGQQLINQIKRDYAQRTLERPNVSDREIRDLSQILGPQYEEEIANLQRVRELQRQNPEPITRITPQEPLPVRPEAQPPATKQIGKVKETPQHVRQKYQEYLGKYKNNPENMINEMNTVNGIKKLRRVLSLTPEGEELFKQLTRYKLDEIFLKDLDRNMKENIKLGTFSKTLKSKNSRKIAKELLGEESFNRIQRLQKVSGELEKSAMEFFNASKSGTTVADVGAITTGLTGLLTGNPYMFFYGFSYIGGLNIASYLLTDPIYLKYLEEAVMTNNPIKFNKILQKMKPRIDAAIMQSRIVSEMPR